MLSLNKFLLLPLLLLGTLSSCTPTSDEVVETAYIYPPAPDPSYSFKRNGASSVDFLECSLVKSPLDHLYASYLVEANIQYPANMAQVKAYFNEGEFSWSPRSLVSRSSLHAADSMKVLADFENLLVSSAKLSGFGAASPSLARNQRASQGKAGYVGRNIGDVNLAFADERGVVVAELFPEMVRGAIYLDQILNVHLDETSVLRNDSLRNAHETGALLPGRNYTALEHHWDLAWGYYQYWLPVVEISGNPATQQRRIALYRAFALGRQALTEYRYADMMEQWRVIRRELSLVAIDHALDLLTGVKTLRNLDEEPANALPFLSQALGAIYALPFAQNEAGKPLLTYAEAQTLIETLTRDGGLWQRERLLGTNGQEGAIKQVEQQILVLKNQQ